MRAQYAQLCRTFCVNNGPENLPIAGLTDRVDLIMGELNRDKSTYGAAFENVRANIERVTVREMKGQGHLAHLQAPKALALLIDSLARDTAA